MSKQAPYKCDFCEQIEAKVFVDVDRIICEECMKTYLKSLRFNILKLSGERKVLELEFERKLENSYEQRRVLEELLSEKRPQVKIPSYKEAEIARLSE